MANEIKFSDLPRITDLAEVDKFLVGCADGSFGYITASDLRNRLVNQAIVTQRVDESIPAGQSLLTIATEK